MIQPGDPWGFDQEPVETWADILGAQAWDLTWLAAFLVLAVISFRRKSGPLKYATLIAAVAYLGFAKSQLISVTNLFSLVAGNLPVVKYNLAFYTLAGFTIVSTLLVGRFYCGRVCAFGALTQLMDAVLPERWRVRVPRTIERRAGWIKFGLLGGTLLYFVVTSDMLIYRYVEPFWMFGMFATTPLWIGLGLLLLASVFVRNLYCRFLCPVGALVCDRVPNQAMVRMQHVPDLPEGVSMGRDRRSTHSHDRMRSVRRLRAAVCGPGQVSTLAHHRVSREKEGDRADTYRVGE
jgi:general stress protein CsbA